MDSSKKRKSDDSSESISIKSTKNSRRKAREQALKNYSGDTFSQPSSSSSLSSSSSTSSSSSSSSSANSLLHPLDVSLEIQNRVKNVEAKFDRHNRKLYALVTKERDEELAKLRAEYQEKMNKMEAEIQKLKSKAPPPTPRLILHEKPVENDLPENLFSRKSVYLEHRKICPELPPLSDLKKQ